MLSQTDRWEPTRAEWFDERIDGCTMSRGVEETDATTLVTILRLNSVNVAIVKRMAENGDTPSLGDPFSGYPFKGYPFLGSQGSPRDDVFVKI